MDEFFHTNDTPLAIALHTAGVPWLDPERPWIVVYDANKMQDEGISIEEAKRQKRGVCWFYFQKTDSLKGLMAAWNEIKQAMKDREKMEIEGVQPDDIMRIMAIGFDKRAQIYKQWEKIPARLQIMRGDDSFTQIGEHAPREILERFGLL